MTSPMIAQTHDAHTADIVALKSRAARDESRVAVLDAKVDALIADTREIREVLGRPAYHDRSGENVPATGLVAAVASLADRALATGPSMPPPAHVDDGWGEITQTQLVLPHLLARRAKSAEVATQAAEQARLALEIKLKEADFRTKWAAVLVGAITLLGSLITMYARSH